MTKLVLCPHFVAHVKDATQTITVTVNCAVCGVKSWDATGPRPPSDNLWDDPTWLSYADHARETLEPMVKDSAVCISLVPGDNHVDPKFAIELGYMIMLDKPIIAIVGRDSKPPNKLVMIADELVEGEVDDPDFQQRMIAAISRVKDLAIEGDEDGRQDQ